jgi:hypothetical protein
MFPVGKPLIDSGSKGRYILHLQKNLKIGTAYEFAKCGTKKRAVKDSDTQNSDIVMNLIQTEKKRLIARAVFRSTIAT